MLWAKRVTRAKKKQEWTDGEMAEYFGCHDQTVYNWRKGRSATQHVAKIYRERMTALAKAPATTQTPEGEKA
jgi:DNA-binding transcriptional regulator YiaG